MRPKERRETGQTDLFRARLDQIVDLNHPLVKLSGAIDWSFVEERCGAVYTDEPGRPPLPTRLMAGLAILKHMHDRSDEVLCERWIETPCWQLFCGEEFFQHTPPFDRSSLTRWRQRMGEERPIALIQESLAVATRTGAAKPADFRQVVIDTTVQEKAITFPTDAKLMHRARERLVRLAQKHGVMLRQTYVRVGKAAQKRELLRPEPGDIDKGLGPGQHCEQRQQKHLVERIHHLAALARVRQIVKIAQKNNGFSKGPTIRRGVHPRTPPSNQKGLDGFRTSRLCHPFLRPIALRVRPASLDGATATVRNARLRKVICTESLEAQA